jgi:hypothetical protein
MVYSARESKKTTPRFHLGPKNRYFKPNNRSWKRREIHKLTNTALIILSPVSPSSKNSKPTLDLTCKWSGYVPATPQNTTQFLIDKFETQRQKNETVSSDLELDTFGSMFGTVDSRLMELLQAERAIPVPAV